MKFETPKMNISMFATENVVVTDSSIANAQTYKNAEDAVITAITGNSTASQAEAAQQIFAFQY